MKTEKDGEASSPSQQAIIVLARREAEIRLGQRDLRVTESHVTTETLFGQF